MTIFYTLLIMFVFAKLIIRCSSRKSYILTGSIISIAVVLADLKYVISNPKGYLMYESWQVLLAFIIYLVYVFTNTSSVRRNRDFNKKIRKETKPYFSTAKTIGMYFIITSFIILLIGIALLLIMLLDIYEDIPYVVFIGSVIGFIGLLLTGIIYIKTANEKFILLIRTSEEFYTYYVNIENKFKFRYMDYIGEIYKYYIIEKIGVFKYSNELKEIHYVWLLDTENLNNFDISKLPMNKTSDYYYKEIIDDISKFRNVRINMEIKGNKIAKIKY